MKSASSPSSPEPLLNRRDVLILGAAIIITLIVYLSASAYYYRPGFPLDDAWIHQTYARNLALRGEWAFIPGQPSAGSTAPLWTLLLAAGFLLGFSPYLWAYLLGGTLLLAEGIVVEMTLRRMFAAYRPAYPWAGLLLTLEWHLAWAAFSGMETMLHILLISLVCGMLLSGSRRYLLMGILSGVSVWVRPDGMTLLGPLIIAIALSESTNSSRLKGIFRLLMGFVTFLAPYFLFNLLLAGTPLPNTFYAKQAEYAAWQAAPAMEKLIALILQFFSGAALILLPGVIRALSVALRHRNWRMLTVLLWVAGYVGLYMMRLPVYQHGRYEMPALAVFLLAGLAGWIEAALHPDPRASQNFSRAVQVLLVATLLAGLFFGAISYGWDTALIESQMVDTARWVNANLPVGARVAAHDIGALGYFSRVNILDLAGLISPDVVPIITDDAGLQAYMEMRGVEYLVAFSGWHPALIKHGSLLYSTGSQYLPRADLGDLAVYRWGKP